MRIPSLFSYNNGIENHNLATILDMSPEFINNPNAKVSEFILHNANWDIPMLRQMSNNLEINPKSRLLLSPFITPVILSTEG